MRHHFHRCPNLRVLTADASDLHGGRRHGSVALDELCEAKRLEPCLGLEECDVLAPAQKRTLLVARATRLREEDGGPGELSGRRRHESELLASLRRELVAERQRLVQDNRRIESEISDLMDVGRDSFSDLVDRGDAAAAMRFDDALEKLSIRRLDAIDRALDAMERGSFGVCTACGDDIELPRLRAIPDAALCITCARSAERR